MKTKPAQDQVDCAQRFLTETVPLVVIELVNRLPAEGQSTEEQSQQAAQKGSVFETWSLQVARYLADHLVIFGVAELCTDQADLAACRILVPFEQIRGHIARWCETPAFSDYLLKSERPERFVDYCADFERYIYEFFAYEQLSRHAPIQEPYEVDLITEFYLLAACDAFSEWAIPLASRVDDRLTRNGRQTACTYRVGGRVC